MRSIPLWAAACVLWGGPAAAQDLPLGGVNQSWTSTQLLLNAEKEAWAAPECVGEGRWAVTCEQTSSAGVPPQSAEKLRFTPSMEVRRRNFARFVQATRAADPAGAAQLETELAGGDLIQTIGETVSPYGLRTDNVADALALYVMEAWEAVSGRTLPPSRERAQAVKRQMERAASASPALARASDAEKQEFAEALLVQAALIGATAEAARNGGGDQISKVAAAVWQGAKAATGLDLRSTTLTEQGLSFVPPGAAGRKTTTATASPATAVEGVTGARTGVGAGSADAALKAALAAVPAEARPVDVVLNGSGGFSGWPPSYVYRVTTYLLFGNGWATACSDWDPSKLRPTPDSLGRAYPDCGLRRWRSSGAGVQLQGEDGSWFSPTGVRGELRAFKPGERLDIAFGNVGGTGFAGAPGAVSTSLLSGSDLRMTSSGEIAVGDWSSVVVSGADIGGGVDRRNGPTVGRYALDGNLIAISNASGAARVGFIAGTPAAGQPEHIYLNGVQFWKDDD